MWGTVLENVVMDPLTRLLDFSDATLAENSRGAYPLSAIPNASATGVCGQPKNLILLTCDAFGVMPPIARLTPAQAMYHFLSGYTAKVAGTERGVTEPTATFSTCFGAPFMPRHPSEYGALLGDYISKNNVTCWLVSTGWTGGAYGEGKRMPIKATRALLNGRPRRVFEHRTVPHRSDLRLRGSHRRAGRQPDGSRPALHMGGRERLRRPSRQTGDHVRAELRHVRSARIGGRARGGAASAQHPRHRCG